MMLITHHIVAVRAHAPREIRLIYSEAMKSEMQPNTEMYEKRKFVVTTQHLLLFLLLVGEVQSVYYTKTDCTGSTVSVVDQAECCVGTDYGLAYSDDGGSCILCIGET